MNDKNINNNNNFRKNITLEDEKETRLTLIDPSKSASKMQPTQNFQQNNSIQITNVYNIIQKEDDSTEDEEILSDEEEYQHLNQGKRIEKSATSNSLTKFSLPLVDIATKKVKRKRTLTPADKKDVAALQEWKCASCTNLLPSEYEVNSVMHLQHRNV